MGTCEVCGNEYDMAFEVVAAGARHVFDSFECAIHKMAPVCEHCGCRIIGHGVDSLTIVKAPIIGTTRVEWPLTLWGGMPCGS